MVSRLSSIKIDSDHDYLIDSSPLLPSIEIEIDPTDETPTSMQENSNTKYKYKYKSTTTPVPEPTWKLHGAMLIISE
eukprot:jgi/Psemu1/2052/gm1.2052_g